MALLTPPRTTPLPDTRTSVPCLLCGKLLKSVQAHFRHHYGCNPKVRQAAR